MPSLVPLACLLLAWADPPAREPAPLEVVTAFETVLTDAIAAAEPAVVAIARQKTDNDTTLAIRGRNAGLPSEPFGIEQLSFDFGSGVVIGTRGEILTAFHVVKGARSLHVRAVGNQSFEAEIIAADPRTDLAVIVPREGAGAPPPKLKPIKLGNASKLRKGAFLLALGNPFNAAARDGRPSASWGILSNVARRIEVSLEERHRAMLRNYPTLLQLDSKLNLGMSGGAVVNLKGELVGITTNSASASGFDAQAGYAFPLDAMGHRAVDALRAGKEVEYGFLGVGLDVNTGTNKVTSAQPGTPAAEGEVQVDDAILAVGDIPVTDADSLVLAINMMTPGARVKLAIDRRGERIERTVELAKLLVDGEVIATNRPPAWRGLRVDYTSTLPHTNFGPDILSAMAGGGVAVVEVEPNSPADRAGLKRGQVVKSVEGKAVRNPRDFRRAVEKRSGPVKLGTDLGFLTVK
jgi:S1-C subfamily serine protease